ncbi:hypothetical protein BAUCODRAFT_66900 [Baudoinia panamericana UAMH 10762]|uniref:Potassium channel domain-containing protein n=1 Tax=Baudoinia panamericana (strain UAMH 10762) TaxID=717646 RepID=M2NFX5_BAUPA|nr:uncharacterized protein BAUCODRAFT_66900 [Baudoinia panamericana UAMH 10762]EMC98179.1 hypothetical protein BAUCODRAFT_66900 [Baudoinia panamericana UAMH 10762]
MSTLDVGLNETVANAADDVEGNAAERAVEEEEEEEADDEFGNPSRWWFASTACPLLAGTFGPIANGFSICALVYNWRVEIPAGGTQGHGPPIPDPGWLLAINAVSLISALVGNATLLLNMARRVKFYIAQPLTITGFYLAGILLIADMAALTASPTDHLTGSVAPAAAHALSEAFYYAIFASVIYMVIGSLMCLTVYGALKGYYEKDFQLNASQRTLMLQTMLFVAYLLLGALVFSKIEGWSFLNAVYWADVTLLTVGVGDYSPMTSVGRGLLIPYALCGILIIGLVIGSLRSLVLERGEQKLAARITEKRRSTAVHNVDERKQTVKISFLASADFSTDPALTPAQRREEEFHVMRKLQEVADNERRWMALAMSGTFALMLWLVGAAIFMVCEQSQQWTYFDAVYFTWVCLLTIGYGDYRPYSNAGRAFFVIWSLLAVPSLTILISDMGDTIIKWFSDLTTWVGSITVLPEGGGFRARVKAILQTLIRWCTDSFQRFSPPGLFGDHEQRMLDRLSDRLTKHIEDDESHPDTSVDELQRDMNFYHYVLARECRNLQKDLAASPPKKYAWGEWEYYLKLIGNEGDPQNHPGQTKLRPNPERREKRRLTTLDLQDWSWLSNRSPLMSSKSEAEWILERLAAALERELNRQRKGHRRKPPISMSDLKKRTRQKEAQQADDDEHRGGGGRSGGGEKGVKSQKGAAGEIAGKEEDALEKAAKSEA